MKPQFFYQPDRDVLVPVVVGMVGQLIELSFAIKLLQKGHESICIFFFSLSLKSVDAL